MQTNTNDTTQAKAIGYCRVSTDNQKEEGTIEIQEKALTAYAETCYELQTIFMDNGVSGGLEQRPGLASLFSYIEVNHGTTNQVESVIIFKLDRLARDLYIQEHLIKKLEAFDVTLISVKEPNLDSSDPMRKAFRQFMGIVSELEKSFITMRLSAGRVNKAQKGGYAGGGPALGYTAKDKAISVNTDQIELVKRIFAMSQAELSLRAIAKELNDQAILSPRGKAWTHQTVKYIINNPIYQGILTYSGISSPRADLALTN